MLCAARLPVALLESVRHGLDGQADVLRRFVDPVDLLDELG